MKKIILASGSPRRQQLMKLLGIPFETIVSNFDEDSIAELDPQRYVEILSQKKAEVVAKDFPEAIIIGADTTVALNGEIFAKPRDAAHAKEMLKKLSGTEHFIITGYTVIDASENKSVTSSVTSRVKLGKMSEGEIDAFIATGEPMDKAGGYAVQEIGGVFVDEIHGDILNIIGLPLKEIRRELRRLGVKILE